MTEFTQFDRLASICRLEVGATNFGNMLQDNDLVTICQKMRFLTSLKLVFCHLITFDVYKSCQGLPGSERLQVDERVNQIHFAERIIRNWLCREWEQVLRWLVLVFRIYKSFASWIVRSKVLQITSRCGICSDCTLILFHLWKSFNAQTWRICGSISIRAPIL